ncbi:MAG TPA: hypothetical protein VLT45_31200 [Kofleriaceae bacterium]|nr:hypothetical protein [Kofleriaceae bacterium]
MYATRLLAVLLFVAACRDATGKQQETPPPQGSAVVATAQGSGTGSGSAVKIFVPQQKPPDTPPNANPDYVPAEFKSGMARWKDTGVYVDGKPIGFLDWAELPITLKPTWIKDKVSDNKPPDCPIEKCPGWKWSQMRFYKFTDYLKAMGIDTKRIKMMHVYGPKFSQTIAVTGKDLQSKEADDFMFRFGSLVGGKAIPHVPPHFGNGKQPDKINSVMIYIDRKPPTITRDGIELDGVPQDGVPYYGEPLRGGVRIYLDDKLATIVKRQELDPKQAKQTPDGELHWSFADFLKSKGVDSSHVVEGWVIRDGRRQEKIPWDQLSKMSFTASSQASGGITLGDGQGVRANSIALHTRAIRPDELPVIQPDEE